MYTLYKKELSSFFSSLTGFITIIVFLLINGLMLWVLETDFNILRFGYSQIDGLFLLGPFVFLFLIPAITMKMFAEERKTGTIEMLLTKPISDFGIIFSKFSAGITLTVFAILPTIVYYISVYRLGEPVGNIDSGAVFGSYIGLFFLGTAFVSIGIFASALTSNQIVSFIIALFFSLFMYLGFETIYTFSSFGKVNLLLKSLGMNHHYASISRGVVDTRDILYFLSVIALFLILTYTVLQIRKRINFVLLGGVFLFILFFNIIGNFLYLRFDLTAEKRYTLAQSTKKLLKEADDIIYFKIYLDGEFPADFKRLRNETREMLNQFRAFNKNLEYEFINPSSIADPAEQRAFYQRLVEKGIQPTQISERKKDGISQIFVFPGAEIIYREKSTVVQLLSSQKYIPEEEILNNSIQNLEYTLTDGIRKIITEKKKNIGFIRGHGELAKEFLFDIQIALSEYYTVENVEINEHVNSLTGRISGFKSDSTKIIFKNKYDALIIAKPTTPFSDKDLFILDQYLMYGGKILWLIDPLNESAVMDSLQKNDEAIAIRNDLRLENILFKYGVRLNPNLLLDIRNVPIPMYTGDGSQERPKMSFVPWYYFPEIISRSNHPIVKNLNAVKTEFVSSIDTIENPVKKTILLTTSEYARILNAPVIISLQIAKEEPDERLFQKRFLPIAVLLEGSFTSAFRNRLDPSLTESPEMGYLEESPSTKMIVISDGDIIKNRYNYKSGYAYPLGFDQYTGVMYGNKEFILNCVNYLCDDDGCLAVRSRDIKLRKLNILKISQEETKYKVINIAVPILLMSLFSGVFFFLRKRFFTK